MGESTPPPLPGFLSERMPFDRQAYRLRGTAWPGKAIHYIDHGPRGAPAVFLQHGNPTWSFLWRRVIRRLGGCRVIAPDLLGFGLSDSLPGLADHSLAGHIEALAELVAELDPERLTLVGQDWGGPLVAGLGARLSERVGGLVLANTSVLAPARPRGTAFHRFARRPVVSDLAFRLFGFPQRVLHKVQGDPGSIRGEVARAYRWPLRGWKRRAAPLALARMVPDSPSHPSMAGLRQGEAWARSFDGPMALVWGTRDPILGRALPWHEEAFPKASVVRTNAGHFLQEEVPEELATVILGVVG